MSKVRIIVFKGAGRSGVSVVENANEWLDNHPECELVSLIPVHDVIPPSNVIESLYMIVKEEKSVE